MMAIPVGLEPTTPCLEGLSPAGRGNSIAGEANKDPRTVCPPPLAGEVAAKPSEGMLQQKLVSGVKIFYHYSYHKVQGWIPAFAGMTAFWYLTARQNNKGAQ